MDFRKRYGPWAVVAGASEGTGRAYARQLAAQGLSLVLIARRSEPLEALAAELRDTHGVQALVLAQDLSSPDAHDRIVEAVGGHEVGLYVSNAGADANNARFLDAEAQAWIDLFNRNVVTTMRCCHHFGRQMVARGRGGILLANSYACYSGGSRLAAYSASKAAELCFAESLWVELRDAGVDVVTIVMGMTDTPAFRQYMAGIDMPLPPGTADPEEVAAFGLANLANGPVQNWGLTEDEAGAAPHSAADRRRRVVALEQMQRAMMGDR